MQQVFEYSALGMLVGSIYALLAIGYTLVFGVLNKLNLAHGDIFMSGAFAAAYLAGAVSPWLVGVVGVAVPVVLGLVLFFLVFDPVRHRKDLLGPAIGSQAFGLILASVASYLAGGYSLQFPAMVRLPDLHVGGMRISMLQLLIVLCAVAAMLAFDALVRRSKFGRSVRAIAENEDAARLLGINVRRESAVAFALSSAMAGIAAMLYSLRYGVVDPFSGFQIGLTGLVVMVLGGVGNVRGAMIGGVALGMIQMLATGLLWSGAQQVVPWIVLVITLVCYPHGLLGGRGIEEKV